MLALIPSRPRRLTAFGAAVHSDVTDVANVQRDLARDFFVTVDRQARVLSVVGRIKPGHTLGGYAEAIVVDPGAAVEALAVIEQEASRTLAEMRTMVGALPVFHFVR